MGPLSSGVIMPGLLYPGQPLHRSNPFPSPSWSPTIAKHGTRRGAGSMRRGTYVIDLGTPGRVVKMSKETQLRQILECGIVAVVRSPNSQHLVEVARALADGGVSVVEITMTVPGALDVVRHVRQSLGDRILLGAGTILDPETARAALLAGAEYLVAPTLNLDVIRMCQRYDKLVMPGAFTPTEILSAWEAGADIVKVFPADVMGPAFFKAIRGPLPQIRLMPTGGVDLTTAAEFLKAGACCLGIGSQLVEPKAVAEGDFDRIRDLARQYVGIVAETRKKGFGNQSV
jgi:2-dehydro-3-deoxyphosphogluconate aldolase / (4S)-4-hydroxy-2-oxoglutarate aldolase